MSLVKTASLDSDAFVGRLAVSIGHMDVMQCPECELRFLSPAELDQHLALDHPEFRARHRRLDEDEFSAARRRKHIRSQAPDDDNA